MFADQHVMRSTAAQPLILICTNLQIEYLTEGRGHAMVDAAPVTRRCLALLALWRERLWPVLHLKRVAQAAWFNPASNLTDWIPDARPRPGELAFEHPLPSAYSSARFAEYMANIRGIHGILIGFSLDETILSTAVDGFHRGHRYQMVSDALACRQPADGDAEIYRRIVATIVGHYAGTLTASEITGLCSQRQT